MSSRMESSHIQKLKGFPGMFSWRIVGHMLSCPSAAFAASNSFSEQAYLCKL